MRAEGRHGLLRVSEKIEDAHDKLTEYPLLPGDILTQAADGTYTKHAPGLGVCGFRLTPEQAAALEPTSGHIVKAHWGEF